MNQVIARSMPRGDPSPSEAMPGPPGADRQEMLSVAVLRAVAYADVFDFALTIPELHRYLVGEPADLVELAGLFLARDGGPLAARIVVHDGHVALAGREELIPLRAERRRVSAHGWRVARRYARAVASLPFVRMVAVTGGLAAGNSAPGADIDLLVVTATGHVWLTRASTIALVRVAARKGHELCPNYFLSEDALALPERGLYAAHELVQMVPISGPATYARIRAANPWVADYLPNASGPPPAREYVTPMLGSLRPLAERVLRTPPGRIVEGWEQARKVERFRARARALGSTGEASFGPDCCKGHFEAHGARIREAYEARLRAIGVEPRW